MWVLAATEIPNSLPEIPAPVFSPLITGWISPPSLTFIPGERMCSRVGKQISKRYIDSPGMFVGAGS